MLEILSVVLPVFLILGAGFVTTKIGYFPTEHADVIMKFVMRIAIPILLFSAISQLDLARLFNLDLLVTYYAGVILGFAIAGLSARFLFERNPGVSVAVGFCAAFSNLVLLGIPIVDLAFGHEALDVGFAIVSLNAPICYFLGIIAMEFARADGRNLRDTLRVATKAMFSNALTIGIALGFVVNLTKLPVPDTFATATDLLGRAGPPAALFALGSILTRYSITHRIAELSMLAVVQLFLQPLLAYWLAYHVFELPEIMATTVVIMAAMPAGLNTYVFADMYDRAKGTAASNVLMATAISVLSISVWLAILAR